MCNNLCKRVLPIWLCVYNNVPTYIAKVGNKILKIEVIHFCEKFSDRSFFLKRIFYVTRHVNRKQFLNFLHTLIETKSYFQIVISNNCGILKIQKQSSFKAVTKIQCCYLKIYVDDILSGTQVSTRRTKNTHLNTRTTCQSVFPKNMLLF